MNGHLIILEKTVIFIVCFMLSSNAFAMTACPPGSVGSKPGIAWSLLLISVIVASVSAFVIGKRAFRFKTAGKKTIVFLSSVGCWFLIVYAGFNGWAYYFFTCF